MVDERELDLLEMSFGDNQGGVVPIPTVGVFSLYRTSGRLNTQAVGALNALLLVFPLLMPFLLCGGALALSNV